MAHYFLSPPYPALEPLGDFILENIKIGFTDKWIAFHIE